jgi:hypothetical protein
VLWHYRLVAVTQRVGSPVQFVQRLPVAGAGRGNLPPFARQLPVAPGGPGFGDHLDHRLGTADLGQGLKPPHHTAPAGLTESGHPTGCVTATLGYATTRGIPFVIQSFCITPIQAALNDF